MLKIMLMGYSGLCNEKWVFWANLATNIALKIKWRNVGKLIQLINLSKSSTYYPGIPCMAQGQINEITYEM